MSSAWVFQSRPGEGDAPRSGTTWRRCVRQNRRRIEPGDRVWFRLTGRRAGIYAVGRVSSTPSEEAPGDWHVDVVVEALLDPPVLRLESDADPSLTGVAALRGLMGTNLSLPAEADSRLAALTADRLTG